MEREQIQQSDVNAAYGDHHGNWGDLDVFNNNYINFGYWKNISFNKNLTFDDRKKSAAELYKHTIDLLNVSSNDVVLEIGSGRGIGMMAALNYIHPKKILGIDSTEAQIMRAQYIKHSTLDVIMEEYIEIDRRSMQEAEKQNQYEQEERDKRCITVSSDNKINTDYHEVPMMEVRSYTMQIHFNNKRKLLNIFDLVKTSKFLVASAYSTGLEDCSINKIYSVEMFQHIENFTLLAREMHRILAPKGVISFSSDFSTNETGYTKLRQENLLVDKIEILAPIDEVIDAFKTEGFKAECSTIGKFVFEGYEKWITQINTAAEISHYFDTAYKEGYIDYYACVATKISDDGCEL
jgi:ubiquinone/menaquinone biosynthesis C-methylase UbiE